MAGSRLASSLQVYGWVLVMLAFAASILRSWVEWRSKQIPIAEQVLAQYQTRQTILALGPNLLQQQPAWLAILAKTLFLTFLFSGLYAHWIDAVLLGGCIGGMLFVRSYGIKPFRTWARWLTPVPILLRLILSSVGAYFFTRWIINTWWHSAAGFRPVLISCLLSILILYLLLPELEPKLRAGGKAKGD